MTSSPRPERAWRVRRSCITVPGSSARMLEKAAGFDADEVILDLEDSVAPSAKGTARGNVLKAILDNDWSQKVLALRVNDAQSPWILDDIEAVVAPAVGSIDCLIVPKAENPEELSALSRTLTDIERTKGVDEGRIGLEIQIESPIGLHRIDSLIAASSRVESVVFGPGDFMAAMQLPTLTIGSTHGAATLIIESALVELALGARRNGVQVIDGPYAVIADLEGFRVSAERASQLGFDGKWVLHPSQIEDCNAAFTPGQSLIDRAKDLLSAYEHHRTTDGRGAAMFDGDMIDEASRKLAEMTVRRASQTGLR